MKQFLNIFFSMKMTLLMLLFFALSIAIATFIENDYGTVTARALVYNTRWFEFLLFLLSLNLLGSVITYKMWRREKLSMFFFHIAFLLILIGAAITRFYGFEGILHLREGESSDKILSEKNYLQFSIVEGQRVIMFEKPLLLTPILDNRFEDAIKLGDKTLKIELVNYIPNAVKTLVPKSGGKKGISLVVNAGDGRETLSLLEGETAKIGGFILGFETKDTVDFLFSLDTQNKIHLNTKKGLEYMKMDEGSSGRLDGGSAHTLENRILYTHEGISFVIENALQAADYTYKSLGFSKQGSLSEDLLELKLSIDGLSKNLTVFGAPQKVGKAKSVEIGGKSIVAMYGAKYISLPYSVALRDFQLERYPGSNSPSSYASEVSVMDNNETFDYRIYMNHILSHKGFRFYQASYDRDELGTILSVNHDYWGTLVTYIGYTLLAIGMLFSLISPNGRVRILLGRLEKSTATKTAFALLLTFGVEHSLNAQEADKQEALKVIKSISVEHAKSFGELLVQDSGGRIKPIDTLSTEILNKVSRESVMLGIDNNQLILGMLIRPQIYQNIKLIHISHPEINELLGLPKEAKYAAFSEFFDTSRPVPYKLSSIVEDAMQKMPSKQSKLDKEALKVDERLNVMYMVFNGSMFRIFPKPNDHTHKWYDPLSSFDAFDEQNGNIVKTLLQKYFESLDMALKSGDYTKANEALLEIKKNQVVNGAAIIPPEYKIKMEMLYNEIKIFENLSPFYLLFGFLLMLGCIIHIIKPFFNLKIISSLFGWILGAGFLLHTMGLVARWIISGHAPWSDGYESMIYVAWASMLAGFIFAKNSPVALASTAIIAGVALFSAHLSWMDPQITNIVPVLNSYWLIIHVSMITASYGFFALGALLGFVALLLMIIKTGKSAASISKSVHEITMVNEMALIVGLVLLTIGNFIGGVWANESWGRYWGWDPKETWALVTILVYAFVLHLRFVPILRSEFIFNSASLVSIASVLMTYFGVNFYLSGLHSYAKGDPVPVPTFVYVSAIVIASIILLAGLKESLFERMRERRT